MAICTHSIVTVVTEYMSIGTSAAWQAMQIVLQPAKELYDVDCIYVLCCSQSHLFVFQSKSHVSTQHAMVAVPILLNQ